MTTLSTYTFNHECLSESNLNEFISEKADTHLQIFIVSEGLLSNRVMNVPLLNQPVHFHRK